MNIFSLNARLHLVWFHLIVLRLSASFAVVFEEVSGLHVWITVSSLVNRVPGNPKSLLFRQIELNWINAPLNDEKDYIALYLDSEPNGQALPVSVHRIGGQRNGQIITDYYLPQIDFYNETLDFLHNQEKPSWRSSSNYHQYFPKSKMEILFTDALTRESSTNSPAQTTRHFDDWDLYRPQSNSMFRVSGNPNRSVGQRVSGQRNLKHHEPIFNDQCIGYCLAYHSKTRILARNCLKTNPNWMMNLFQAIGSKSLPWLMIPGTHNSGTYPRQLDRSVLQMINKYQLNQDESVFNQLTYGIRHLDLRVGYSKVRQRSETLWIYHDIFRTEVSLNEVFEQVKLFLDLTSHEIIIMDFHRFTVGFENENTATQNDRHAKLIDLLFSELGNYIVPCFGGQHEPIRDYVNTGKRLVIGYANRGKLLRASSSLRELGITNQNKVEIISTPKPVRDIDAPKQDIEDSMVSPSKLSQSEAYSHAMVNGDEVEEVDRRVGTRLFNKLKSLKLISKSFSKRAATLDHHTMRAKLQQQKDNLRRFEQSQDQIQNSILAASLSRISLFCPAVVHMWPNKDTLEGFAQYLNETTCRKYIGDLRSMMVELTPTVFGVIADKYDGNRKLAQLVNRQVTDWIRDRWLHCVNAVASDHFLGNDLIRLAILANRMRALEKNIDFNDYGKCKSFRQVEHLLDKSKIPLQFTFHDPSMVGQQSVNNADNAKASNNTDYIAHTSSDGRQLHLIPLVNTLNIHLSNRDKRESFVDNVSESFTNIFSSLRRFLNL